MGTRVNGHYIDFERAERRIKKRGRYFRTQKEVAEIIGVSLRTLQNMLRDETLHWPLKRVWKLCNIGEFDGKVCYVERLLYDVQDIIDKLKEGEKQ